MTNTRPGSYTTKSGQNVIVDPVIISGPILTFIRMPAYQTDTPVLVLNCDREFETDKEQADQHIKKVAEFILSL